MMTEVGSDTFRESLSLPDQSVPDFFDPATVADLPAPAARWLTRALPDCTPIFRAVQASVNGSIKIGRRWMPFTADLVLRAGLGCVWDPVIGRGLWRFVGTDVLGPEGAARIDYRLHGLIPVNRVSGLDLARSSVGRLALETVAWLPQATTPQAGGRWSAVDDRRAVVSLGAGKTVPVEITVDDDGRLEAVGLLRWNNMSEPPALERYGGLVTDEYRTDGGVIVAGAGCGGWGFGTREWPDGEFFRYEVDQLEPIKPT